VLHKKIWRELNEKIIDTLNSYTLKDLVDIQKAIDKGNTTGPASK
jgi:DNA-binding IscR family transcriptional regulator